MEDHVFVVIAIGSGFAVLAGIVISLRLIEWVERNVLKWPSDSIFKLPL